MYPDQKRIALDVLRKVLSGQLTPLSETERIALSSLIEEMESANSREAYYKVLKTISEVLRFAQLIPWDDILP
jgi:hypothetical protein